MGPLYAGALGCVFLQTSVECIVLGGAAAGHSPVFNTVRSFLQKCQTGLEAFLLTSSYVACGIEVWIVCPPSPAPTRHPRPKCYFLLEREVSVVAPRL